MASNRHMNWNDGEGMDERDWIRAQRLMEIRFQTDEPLYTRALLLSAVGRMDDTIFLVGYDAGAVAGLYVWDLALTPLVSVLNLIAPFPGLAMHQITALSGPPGTPANDFDPLLRRWHWDHDNGGSVDSPGFPIAITANASGNPRYDIISVNFTEIDTATESRDFEDSATRELTSTTPNKRTETRATFTVTEGTPGASPVIPTPSTGERWCAVLVPDGGNLSHEDVAGLPGIIDFSLPISAPLIYGLTPGRLGFGDSFWTPDPGHVDGATLFGVSTATASKSIIFLPPGALAGDPTARLMRVGLAHAIDDNGITVELGRIDLSGAASTFTVIDDVTGALGTTDATDRLSELFAGGSTSDPTKTAIWGNGYAAGRSFRAIEPPTGAAANAQNTVALRLTKAANTDIAEIQSVEWCFAK